MAPLVVVVGPTASGKTSVAIEVAERFGGEIICADSRTIYKSMDIGTAKPTASEQARVPHWGLDLVEPGDVFTASDFKTYALQKIDEIRARGAIPFLVGGTGLYVDSIVLDYQFGPPADPNRRAELESWTLEQLQQYCVQNNIKLPENKSNKRYVIRAIELNGTSQQMRGTPIDNVIIVGIATERDVHRERIQKRSYDMLENGVIQEAAALAETYGWNSEAMTGNIYPLVKRLREGELTEQEFVTRSATADWKLAKRQLTWFKRRSFIQWLPLDQVVPYLSDRLAQREKS